MKIGLDIFLEKDFEQFKGKRIGIVTNLTGVNQELVPAIDLFFEHGSIELTALYGPEHGIRGDAMEGEKVDGSIDEATGLPVYSLYGETRKPSAEMLENVDVMVFDLQDIGSRYFTYIYTMANVMEACAAHDKEFVVLDRPNPVTGTKMEGNLVEENVRSFVGLFPLPNRHGMTVGELALLFKHEYGYDCKLSVIRMEGWKRSMYYDETGLFWVPSSPNTTNIDMNILYTGTCLMEGTNLSEGRGTAKPFEWVGAPYMDGKELAAHFNEKGIAGIVARPITFRPTYQKHEGVLCSGVQLHIADRDQVHSLRTGVELLCSITALYPDDFEFLKTEKGKYFFDLLAGTKSLKKAILQNDTDRFFDDCDEELEIFQNIKEKYLLYR